jgi:peptidoglycan/xylan/chitin deacetylase (PgdA/CDA1 family)
MSRERRITMWLILADNAVVAPLLRIVLVFLIAASARHAVAARSARDAVVHDKYGAIIRGDVNKKSLAVIFTGDEKGESTAPILDTLRDRKIRAGFFVTGNFARDAKLRPLLERAAREGHYLGPHSDSHPLYCDWDNRNKSLVTQKFFTSDLQKNIRGLREVAGSKSETPKLFVPPYEWFNADQVRWSNDMGITLFNFTPGSGSNRDYAPEGDRVFVPSQKIYDDILAREEKDPHGLNGFILLLHLGSGRKDPFHAKLAPLCDELTKRGYKFVRIDELISKE